MEYIMDGACILTAFYNDRGLDNLEKALEKLVAGDVKNRWTKML